jgi:hypothetical protein
VYFTITIDTEEDNWGEYDCRSYSVENIGRLPRLQERLAARGVRPTYLISYPVATNPTAVAIIKRFHESGQCEIGSHPHPWNTPPVEEERTPFNSFICHLPADLQYRKLKTLHDAIVQNFGIVPTTYRSGRWGFNHEVAAHLMRLGYTVDTSISAGLDWRAYGGPDYSAISSEPFTFRAHRADGGDCALLEVPATTDYVQGAPAIARSAHRAIHGALPFGNRVLGALARLGVVNLVCVSPELADLSQMVRLTQALQRRNASVVNMFLHSPSLLEGCSPFARTPSDVDALLDRIDGFVIFAQSAGLRPMTMSQLPATGIGASTVKVLPRLAGDPGENYTHR